MVEILVRVRGGLRFRVCTVGLRMEEQVQRSWCNPSLRQQVHAGWAAEAAAGPPGPWAEGRSRCASDRSANHKGGKEDVADASICCAGDRSANYK